MKKKFLFIFILLILSMGIISAVDVNMKKEVKQGENIIIKVSGKFYTQLTNKDIEFKRIGHTSPPQFPKINLERIEGSRYFYLTIPETIAPGEYSMIFKDAEYYIGNTYVKKDIVTNFTILNEMVPFTISPALVISKDNYLVTIQNLKSTEINVNLEKEIIPIYENKTEESESLGFFDLLFGTGNKSIEKNETVNNTNTKKEVKHITLVSGEKIVLEFEAPLYKGFETMNLYDGSEAYGILVYNPEGKIFKEETNIITNITVNEIVNETTNITVNETTNITTLNNKTENEDLTDIKSCTDLGGRICGDDEKCPETETTAKDSQCCLVACEAVAKKSTNGKFIGWLIIGVIALFLTWFFKNKYRNSSPGKVDLIKSSKPKK